jgi:hypothetical protein
VADDPTYSLSIPGDLNWKCWPGQKAMLQQAMGAVKHFIITGVGYSSPNIIQTLYGGTNYDLANSPIIEPYFSSTKAPFGFPLNEANGGWRA